MTFPDTIPNDEAHVWATMIPLRAPEFKVHKNEGLANSAIGNRSVDESYAKYELVDGIWVKRLEYIPGTNCDNCHQPFYGNLSYDDGRNRKVYFYKGPKYLAPVICHKCVAEDYNEHVRQSQEKRERDQLARLQAKYN